MMVATPKAIVLSLISAREPFRKPKTSIPNIALYFTGVSGLYKNNKVNTLKVIVYLSH